jgi:hypothetical protein
LVRTYQTIRLQYQNVFAAARTSRLTKYEGGGGGRRRGGGKKEQNGWVENRRGIRRKNTGNMIIYMKGNGRNERKRMSEEKKAEKILTETGNLK